MPIDLGILLDFFSIMQLPVGAPVFLYVVASLAYLLLNNLFWLLYGFSRSLEHDAR